MIGNDKSSDYGRPQPSHLFAGYMADRGRGRSRPGLGVVRLAAPKQSVPHRDNLSDRR